MQGFNKATGLKQPIEVDQFAGALNVITSDHNLIHKGRAYTLSGSMSVANAQTGAVQIRTGGVKAAVTIDMTNATSDLTYTAVAAGNAGNNITVTHVDPGGVTAALAVTVSGTAITVSLARTTNAISSTAALVKAAVNAHAEASLLVTCEDEGAGSGIVNAVTVTSLAGGHDSVHCHFKSASIYASAGPVAIAFREDATVAGGTPQVPVNRKRSGTVPTSGMDCKFLANATVTGGSGDTTLEAGVLSGATLPGNFKIGDSANASEEWVLDPDKDYVISFSNTSGGASVVGYNLFWYEEDAG